MEGRINRMVVSFSTFEEHEKEERGYWDRYHYLISNGILDRRRKSSTD